MEFRNIFRSALVQTRLVVSPLLLCSVLIGSVTAHESDEFNLDHRGFTIAGVTLGMDFESVVKIYPTAKTERSVANCYSYGRAISVPEHTRRTLRNRYKKGTLTLTFEPPSDGGRLSRIHLDRPVEPSPEGIRKLLDRLSDRYGPYDKILYRRKMEPAGRIVGFEWYYADGATMQVVLRDNFDNGRDGIRLSILARSVVPTPGPDRQALSLSCRTP